MHDVARVRGNYGKQVFVGGKKRRPSIDAVSPRKFIKSCSGSCNSNWSNRKGVSGHDILLATALNEVATVALAGAWCGVSIRRGITTALEWSMPRRHYAASSKVSVSMFGVFL